MSAAPFPLLHLRKSPHCCRDSYTQSVAPSHGPAGQESPLLGTKFHIPAMRPRQVRRKRLLDKMERGAGGKLILVSAPPGFGKTSLLAEWAASLPPDRSIAWLSLDHADDHPVTFWKYVVSALSMVRPTIGSCGALELLEGPQPTPTEAALSLVLNEVAAAPGTLWLVLDDYHVIETASIESGMTFVLEHLPPQMHVILASRVDPALPLPRFRARGELTEIRAEDLRLTTEEADAFLNELMGLGLDNDDVARLETRTEGWAGALQLAALSLQGRPEASEFIRAFSGDDRYIVDYLVEEVLQRQPAPVRDFLLKTSILERLSASLCDAVTGTGDGRSMLDRLERANLFVVPLDDQRRWFRYHQLFADVLQAQLTEQFPGEVAKLHARASDWYAANLEPDRAIRHALDARDFPRAAAVVEREAESVQRRHHPDRLIDWLKAIPDSVIKTMPVLSTYYGHALQGMGDMEGSAARLADAQRALSELPSKAVVHDQRSFEMLPALIATGQGFLSMVARDGPATIAHATRALDLFASDEHHWRGTAVALLGLARWIDGDLEAAERFQSEALACFIRSGDTGLSITSSYHAAELLKARGRLTAAKQRLEDTLEYLDTHGGAARGAANLLLGLADLSCERNDLAGAAAHLASADRLGIFPPRTPFRRLLGEARLRQCEGDPEQAVAILNQAERLQIRGAVPDFRPLAAWRTRLWVEQGRVADALDWARKQGISAEDELHYAREYDHITLARILLAQRGAGDVAAANALLERLLEAAESGGRHGTALEIRLLLAVAHAAEGDTEGALEALEPALRAAEPEGYVRVFLEAGTAMPVLLRLAAERGVSPEYCRRLLGETSGNRLAATSRAHTPDALSERELDVLRLLATELSGPQIAAELVVSLNTLRTHTKNIYGKLEVNSRRAAVRRATELGLL